MTFERLVNMVANVAVRRLAGIGVGRLFLALARGQRPRPEEAPAEEAHATGPQAVTGARVVARRARQTLRLLRRLR